MSQLEIETRFLDVVERIRARELTPQQAFGSEEEWTFAAEGQRFQLHPGMVRWTIYDRLHEEWYDSGYGPGQALMVPGERRGAATRLPEGASAEELSTVGDWCLVVDRERPLGVWRLAQVARMASAGELPEEARVWCGATDHWLTPQDLTGLPPIEPARNLALLPPKAKATPATTASASAGERLCTECGAELPRGARFCSACGRRVDPR